MRFTIYAGFVAIAASIATASAVPAGPTDAQIKELTRTKLEPPFNPPQPRGKDDVGFVYPTSSKVVQAKQDGKCDFTVYMDVARCAGMGTKQSGVVYPYDSYSMDMIHGNIKFESGQDKAAPYAQNVIKINKCGFNGRFFLMDQYSDNIFDTSRMAVRLTVEEGKATSWVTAQIDEETGQAQNRVAPLIKKFYGDNQANAGRITGDENMRGMKLSTMTTTNTTGNYLALQWC